MLKIGIITQTPEAQINLDKDLYIKLAKQFKKLYIIDLSFNNKKKIKLPKNFIYLRPNNINEVKEIFYKKKFLCFNFLAPSYSNLKLFFLLKKFEIKHFFLMRSGTLKMNEDLFIKKNNRLDFYQILLRKIFFKILILLNLIYNYEILFISQKIKKISYHSKRNEFLNKLFNTKKFFLYKKIIQINDKTYDLNYSFKKNKEEKIISFIDTPLNEPGKVASVFKPNNFEKKKFYTKLRNLFNIISKQINMRLIICLHPKTPKRDANKYFRGFKLSKFKSSEIIKKSYLNIYLSSTLISESIYLKKNILLIKSNLLGDFHLYRVNRLIKKFNLNSINLDNNNFNLNRNLKFKENSKLKSYKSLAKELNVSQNITGTQSVIRILRNYIY